MELLKKLKVSRRFALRGALGGIGVAMWLPVLDAMCDDNGTAFAAGEPLPTTFGVWFWGNGIHTDQWTPKTAGNGDAWQLPVALESFAEVKDSMTLVTGLDMMDAKFKGHGWGVVYVLAGGDGNMCTVTSDLSNLGSHQFETSNATQYKPTIDRLILAQLKKTGPKTLMESLDTGMIPFTGDMAMGSVGSNLAHNGPNDFLEPQRDLKKLFDKLMSYHPDMPATGGAGSGAGGSAAGGSAAGGSAATGVPSDISFKTRRSVLDAVLEDCKRLKPSLGAADAQRLDSHMEGIRTLELSIPAVSGGPDGTTGGTGNATVSPACKIDAPPATLADMTAKSHAMNQLIVAALSCNLTRVFTHLWSGPRSDSQYPTLNYTTTGHHKFTHDSDGAEPRAIERYIMSQYADLAKMMKASTMGAGTLLDNSLIYGVSDVAEPKGHVMSNYHMVLMGKGGGKLAGNRHVRIPGRKVTELMLTMQQVMGLPVSDFGTWDHTTKTVPEILV
jgi:hypothetical protein